MSAPAFPADLESDELTLEGPVHVRPIRPDDADALVEFHDGLSHDTQYLRFFSAHPHLSPREIDRFTHVDYGDRLALVVESDGHLLAVGRYDRVGTSEGAEVAFVVADAHQGHGLCTMLLHRLAAAAPSHGITRFVAETLPGNHRMQRVFLDAGYPVRSRFVDGVVEVEFPIAPAS
jgi:RimJ/RimL family protein N-acetyltransferase